MPLKKWLNPPAHKKPTALPFTSLILHGDASDLFIEATDRVRIEDVPPWGSCFVVEHDELRAPLWFQPHGSEADKLRGRGSFVQFCKEKQCINADSAKKQQQLLSEDNSLSQENLQKQNNLSLRNMSFTKVADSKVFNRLNLRRRPCFIFKHLSTKLINWVKQSVILLCFKMVKNDQSYFLSNDNTLFSTDELNFCLKIDSL